MILVSKIDNISRGFLDHPPEPSRYGGQDDDPNEAAGIILRLVPEGCRVLDVGCGVGDISKLLVDRRRVNLIGLEPDPSRAEIARSRGVKVKQEYLSLETSFLHGKFDVVLLADVLEHVSDPVTILEFAGKLLFPSGQIIISVPNIAHWSIRLNLLRGRFTYRPAGIMDATHLRWFTAAVLSDMCRRAGFHVCSTDVSAGVTMTEYRFSRPWKWLPPKLRDSGVRFLAKKVPNLFGLQHVIAVRNIHGE